MIKPGIDRFILRESTGTSKFTITNGAEREISESVIRILVCYVFDLRYKSSYTRTCFYNL